jgi:hypothetical protein
VTNRDEVVLMIAGQIQEHCTEAMLAWGAAVNRAEADPGNESLKLAAQQVGREALQLAIGFAKRLAR